MQLVITVKDGATNREIAQTLMQTATRMDENILATAETKATKTPVRKAAPPTEEDTDFVTQTANDSGFDDDTTIEKEEKPAKKTRPKKTTLDDVNDACKAHAMAKGRDATLGILQKKFKTQSVTALKPEQWETCIAAMTLS